MVWPILVESNSHTARSSKAKVGTLFYGNVFGALTDVILGFPKVSVKLASF